MKKRITAILVITMLFFTFLVGCGGNAEQDIESILESELLISHGIAISIPEYQYYRFHDSDDLAIEVALVHYGEHGTYYFTAGNWTDELIAEIILVGEEGLRFAKDFLDIEVSRPLNFVFNATEPGENHPLPFWGGGIVLDTSTFISQRARNFPALLVHEAVHAILTYDGRITNFPLLPETSSLAGTMLLEEGLCDLIDFLFAQQTEHRYPTNYGNDHLHTRAVETLNRNDDFSDELEFGTRYQQLMSYVTSASFIYFLLEYHGTAEDFMRVFDDIYLMEEVLGQNMEDMIAEWLDYLNENW